LAEIALEMGAGRKLKTDVLDMAAGVELLGLRLLDTVLTLSNKPVVVKSRVLVAIDGVHFEEKFHLCRNLKTGWVTLSSGGDAPLPIQ
jgi:hypothetical protein